jgi:DNA replication and repair protein RecF
MWSCLCACERVDASSLGIADPLGELRLPAVSPGSSRAAMHLSRLDVRNLRCISECVLDPSAQLNVIWGANASGKTSLLEAVHVLGSARSFRTSNTAQLIRRGTGEFSVFAQLRGAEGGMLPLGIAREPRATSVRIGGRCVKQTSELAAHLPLLLINQDSHQILSDGPQQRRRLLDWGVFHGEPRFLLVWQHYQRALKQRNETLRQGERWAHVTSWDREIERCAEQIHEYRSHYMERLQLELRAQAAALLRCDSVDIEYHPGWPAEEVFAEVLARSRERDRALGYTSLGPHRADLALKVDGLDAEQSISNGEQKLLLCGLRLAQIALLRELTDKQTIILIDDLPAELDAENRKRLLQALLALGGQVFVTTTELSLLDVDLPYPTKLFHLENGAVTECETP